MARKPKIVLESGNGSPMAFAEELQRRATPEMVDKAVRSGACELAYQPIVSAGDIQNVLYYEGLIRVFDRKRRVIPARDFIFEVQDTETGRMIDLQALSKTVRALKSTPGLHLSFNTSARSIGYAPWTDKLSRIVRSEPDIAGRMTIEISEKSVLQLPEIVSRFINDLSPKGVRFSLDDFGAGLSSMKCLRDIPFSSLKLDGSFIRGVSSNRKNQAAVMATCAMAQHLGMNVIAESVEHISDMHWLQHAGVAALQGYLFGIPTISPEWQAN